MYYKFYNERTYYMEEIRKLKKENEILKDEIYNLRILNRLYKEKKYDRINKFNNSDNISNNSYKVDRK